MAALLHCTGVAFIYHWLFARRAVRVLTYHAIERIPSNSYSVSAANFEHQMEYLRRNCNVIPLGDLHDALAKTKSLPPQSVVITFDDGFRNFHTYAYPVLRKYRLPATCFIITSKIGDSDECFMKWGELEQILRDGLVTVGSHTVSHRPLSSLDASELEREIRESRDVIRDNLGVSVNCLSYPYGTRRDYDDRCIQVLRESGYKLACTSINGVNTTRAKGLELRRTKIEWGDDLGTFRRIVTGALDIWVLADYCLGFLQNKREVEFG